MPNNSYLRSAAKERSIVNDLREQGYWAARSAGSKSPWDVWAFHPLSGEVRLIQVKTKKGGRGLVVRDDKVYPATVITATYAYGGSRA